ncbi:MAG TPA: nucleotide sugar dehydrogenase [Gemmatimonadaceae bacterium]|jgi:UDP-N-acetyl-D-mannosaminuronic acid dehydrogenase|nr:nucleotide sugar dehydrogenase [Gemmatimonadaceae bacterium]
MPLKLDPSGVPDWHVKKIAVVGPGIVGMPMAALLAHARIREGSDTPATVLVVQRASPTSGWKVDAINAGKSPIGGVEPDLDRIVAESVKDGLLSATSDYAGVRDADVILVCVQTDKTGFAPDYGPLFEALGHIGEELRHRPAGNMPIIVFESTLAPSSMATLIKDHFAKYGLIEGRDLLLGNSPNRVMPGRLVERVAASDKLVGGLHPITPELVKRLYARIVTGGTLYPTNSMTAESVKTLENAYRDVRIAYSAEVARACDEANIDFYAVRDQVNARLHQADGASSDPNAVPSGGLLIPTVGVGGHCLPKDGILFWWRRIESGADTSKSLILEARRINDASPAETVRLAEQRIGSIAGKSVALLGTAYRFNSEDTRNSPTLSLARLLLDRGCTVRLHDPYVKPDDQNLAKFKLTDLFTNDMAAAVRDADILIMCTGHRDYLGAGRDAMLRAAPKARALIDGCNLYRAAEIEGRVAYTGIGRGAKAPSAAFLESVYAGFRIMERGLANEVLDTAEFLNERYASNDPFNRVQFTEVQRLAGTCVTGCAIADPGAVSVPAGVTPFRSTLVERALAGARAPETITR